MSSERGPREEYGAKLTNVVRNAFEIDRRDVRSEFMWGRASALQRRFVRTREIQQTVAAIQECV
jgi:hypothetical protein